MIDIKLLRDIPALKLDHDFEMLHASNMGKYEQSLASFIENFPIIERRLKNALEAKDKKAIAEDFTKLCIMLKNIKANNLVAEGSEFLKVLKSDDCGNERMEAFLSVFLVTVAMLSIDIHMAKYLKEDSHAAYISKKSKKVAAKKPRKKTILAVDDTAVALTLLKKCLEGAPCNLTCVNSGKDALRYLENNEPDLFILDIEMPQMDGYKLAGKIRETGHKAPIIFLTNYSSKEYLIKALDAGASDFIVKPIYKANLDEKIHKYLS